MPVPTHADLQAQHDELSQKVQRLKEAHDLFLREWESIARDERMVSQDIQTIIDKTKLYALLQKIHSIKET